MPHTFNYTFFAVPKSPDLLDKIKKNVLIRYEYPVISDNLSHEIEEAEKNLLKLYQQRARNSSILLPDTHPIFETRLLNFTNFVEFSYPTTNKVGSTYTNRELYYLEEIKDVDVTGTFNSNARYFIEFSDENYKELKCTYISSKSIVRLSGVDLTSISAK